MIIYSKNSEADPAFLRDVLRFPNVDVGNGWLIFALPPAEVAVHPSAHNNLHELYLMVKDIKKFARFMDQSQVNCSQVRDLGWGLLSEITLPGGGKLGFYQPRHARPTPAISTRDSRKGTRQSEKAVRKTILPRAK